MKVVVLLGGPSSEREVSLMSGSAMAIALESRGHDITLLDPANGKFMRLAEFQASPPNKHPPKPGDLTEQGRIMIECLTSDTIRQADVVMLGLHGVPGEDGLIQSLLELQGTKYTGSNARTSSLCIDKVFTKAVLRESGLAVPLGGAARKGVNEQDIRILFENSIRELGLPIVIKPNDQGSTVGLTILRNSSLAEFQAGIELCWIYSDTAVVEEFIDGRELTVAVLDKKALPIVEIAPEGGFYDYHHKYTKGMTVYSCPADLPDEVTAAIQADALRASELVGVRGYCRIDYRLRPDYTYSCLEINTLPGMTSTSLVPKAAKAANISFEDLCESILASAFL